ncbi:MAG: phosphoribosylanthranilate isomerase [Dehalococcoidales bacterium]|nr:phosphoribosylanthranilate isomerase [Dehalococcoidales bacterium]
MTKIKICGITQIEHALVCAKAGADFIGLVFAPSKRQIDKEKALQITSVIRALAKRPLIAGVFVNLPASEVNETAKHCRLDYVQLSGNEDWYYCKDIDFPIIKVIHIPDGHMTSQVIDEIEAGYKAKLKHKLLCLLDTKTGNNFGGTGKVFDWSLAKEVASKCHVIIAGGLSADNVGQLIKSARPWGVDVSTGVETDGIKDIEKIRSFINTIRRIQE